YTFLFLTIVLVYGDECENKEEGLVYNGCSVYQIESQNECPLAINNGEGNFVFYIKAHTRGNLSISLHESYGSSSNQITSNLFTTRLSDDNEWHKILIRRGDIGDGPHGESKATYFLEVDDHLHPVQHTDISVGNQIRVNTVASLWTSECDLRQYTTPQPTNKHLLTPKPTTPTLPLIQSRSHRQYTAPQPTNKPLSAPNPATTTLPSIQSQSQVTTKSTVTGGETQPVIIAAVSLVLILVAILVTVIMVLRHRRRKRDQALTQPTDCQNRYGSYDNQGTGENQVP
ncbi:unnamed protein product, partial [Meganyctiphanes norvegica]